MRRPASSSRSALRSPEIGRGRLFVEPERLDHPVTRLDAAGFQIHMHAFGRST